MGPINPLVVHTPVIPIFCHCQEDFSTDDIVPAGQAIPPFCHCEEDVYTDVAISSFTDVAIPPFCHCQEDLSTNDLVPAGQAISPSCHCAMSLRGGCLHRRGNLLIHRRGNPAVLSLRGGFFHRRHRTRRVGNLLIQRTNLLALPEERRKEISTTKLRERSREQ